MVFESGPEARFSFLDRYRIGLQSIEKPCPDDRFIGSIRKQNIEGRGRCESLSHGGEIRSEDRGRWSIEEWKKE